MSPISLRQNWDLCFDGHAVGAHFDVGYHTADNKAIREGPISVETYNLTVGNPQG